MRAFKKTNAGFSHLTELLITIAIIGAITGFAVPVVSNIFESSKKAKNLANAKQIEQVSAALAGMGVAHVIPESMGGVEATARLLREGVIVPEGPMAGEKLAVPGLRDSDIEELNDFLRVQYDMRELRLVLKEGHTSMLDIPELSFPYMFCFATNPETSRIGLRKSESR